MAAVSRSGTVSRQPRIRVRRTARRVVAEYGPKCWTLPLEPPVSARAAMACLGVELDAALATGLGAAMAPELDTAALTGPAIAADWARLPLPDRLLLLRGVAQAWELLWQPGGFGSYSQPSGKAI